MVDYPVYLSTNYSLPVLIFNNPQIQYFPFSIVFKTIENGGMTFPHFYRFYLDRHSLLN